jgi:carbonic anhydrase
MWRTSRASTTSPQHARAGYKAKHRSPAILGCADSRVAPELAFDQSPGDLFVVRVAGNFVTPEGLASLEFGAAVLGTKLIMVLGHGKCGAVNATVAALQKGNTLPGRIADLVRAMKLGIEPVLKQSSDDLEQRAVIANVRYNVERLQHAKPILAEMVAKNEIRVVGPSMILPRAKSPLSSASLIIMGMVHLPDGGPLRAG